MTPQACRLLPPERFRQATHVPVYADWEDIDAGRPLHIEIATWADVIIVAPATANTLARLAWGIADNLLLTCLIARRCPLVVAPAMNPAMLAQPSTQRCLAQLRADGAHIVTPAAPSDAGCMVDLSEVARHAGEALHRAVLPDPDVTR